MGRYASLATIVPLLMTERVCARLTNSSTAATTVDETVLEAKISDAEAEVDAHLGVRYALPLADVPQLVTQLASRITRYRLLTMSPGEIESWIEKEYTADLATLRGIAKGTVELGLTAAGEAPGVSTNTGRQVVVSSTAPVFGRTNLADF